MARLKKGSATLKKAERRAAGMGTIDPKLDLGSGMTVTSFWTAINSMRQTLITYNALLSRVDQVRHDLQAEEERLASLSERMLTAVAAKYGRESAQYEMAGGTKRPRRRSASSSESTSESTEEPSPSVDPSADLTPPDFSGPAPAMA